MRFVLYISNYSHAFQSVKDSGSHCPVDSKANLCPGLPQSLSTKLELCTLLSVAIFTGTVQHAATNNGQVLETPTHKQYTHLHTLSGLLKVRRLTLTSCHVLQFDWCAWVPNTPCTMRQPPPKDKDVSMEMIMATLPDVSQSCVQMAITWHLGRPQPDAVSTPRCVEEICLTRVRAVCW